MEESRLRRLIEAGRSLSAVLDPDVVLDRLLEIAQELTGARYGAIGVLGEGGEELERFLTRGIDREIHRSIGELPKGRGVLGLITRERRPVRVADVGSHPESYGFPLTHPPMRTFLGVPILMRGEAWGNLYLTEKRGGIEFTPDDEEAAATLAGWAALAVANARMYSSARRQRDELQRANRGLETMADVNRALGGVTDLERVLALVVKRSRVLLGARVAALALLRDGELVIADVAGEATDEMRGKRLPLSGFAGETLRTGRPRRVNRLPDHGAYRMLGARTALVAPMLLCGKPVGFVGVFDRETGDGGFSYDDERLLLAFAGSAAAAVVTAELASGEALRRSVRAAERERGYWARALNDETLQSLAALRVLLSSARARDGRVSLDAAVDEAIDIITDGIAALRSLIVELRPASLDELGPAAAIETLVEHVRTRSELDIVLDVRLAYEEGRTPHRHLPEIEVAIFRLVQEGLRNVVEHACARSVRIRVAEAETAPESVEVEVDDDGRGFDAAQAQDGFGLLGIREHVALVDGDVLIAPRPGGGTRLYGRIPVRRRLSSG